MNYSRIWTIGERYELLWETGEKKYFQLTVLGTIATIFIGICLKYVIYFPDVFLKLWNSSSIKINVEKITMSIHISTTQICYILVIDRSRFYNKNLWTNKVYLTFSYAGINPVSKLKGFCSFLTFIIRMKILCFLGRTQSMFQMLKL